MQEMIRAHYDQYLEELGSDSAVKSPLIFSIPKGVPIPTALTLFREDSCRFSLQPAYRMPLVELNSLLDTFYSEHADKVNLEQWLDDNDFEDAVADDAEAQWMAK
ncbi:hypothetical protein MMC16_003757 [Acarospora aff. strigata]|nr:hypothetical protein [Acarospora aff. strigata]